MQAHSCCWSLNMSQPVLPSLEPLLCAQAVHYNPSGCSSSGSIKKSLSSSSSCIHCCWVHAYHLMIAQHQSPLAHLPFMQHCVKMIVTTNFCRAPNPHLPLVAMDFVPSANMSSHKTLCSHGQASLSISIDSPWAHNRMDHQIGCPCVGWVHGFLLRKESITETAQYCQVGTS